MHRHNLGFLGEPGSSGLKNPEVLDLPRKLATCSYHPNSLGFVTQIIPGLKPSDNESFVFRRRSKNPNIRLGRTTRASMRKHARSTLHIDDCGRTSLNYTSLSALNI